MFLMADSRHDDSHATTDNYLLPILPVQGPTREEVENHPPAMRELAEEIGKHSPANVSVEEIMDDIRRTL
jgi:hypothetical protein